MKPDISIIILNYNAESVLKDCLASIETQKGLAIQTIVVDNNSKDNSLEMIKTHFPEVTTFKRSTSEGFAAGNNAGLPFAKADTILFLNPDTKFVHPTDLKRCFEKFKATKNIGLLTCRIDLAITGKIDETCHRGFPTPWAALTHFIGLGRLFPKSKLFGQYLMSYLDLTTEHEIDAAGGMFMLLTKKVGDEVGWWDEDYPLYGEDIDLCFKIKQAGYKILYWPEVTVMHYKGFSTGMSKHSSKVSSASKDTTKRVKGWSIQAMEIFYRKHYQQSYPTIINWLVFLGIKILKIRRVNLA